MKFEMLLLAEMEVYERHFEWYFYLIKYCLHYFCIKSSFHVLSNPYSFCEAFDQGWAKSFTHCTNDFSKMLSHHSPSTHRCSLAVVVCVRCVMTLPTPWDRDSRELLSFTAPRDALKITTWSVF